MTKRKKLPKGWRWAKLGDICSVTGGGTPSRKVSRYFTGSIPWATPTDVTALNELEFLSTATHITEEAIARSSTKLLPEGSVLLTSRATIGYTAINTVPMCTNQGFANFTCGPEVSNYYLAYYLPFIKETLLQLASGATFKEINKTTLKALQIPLPPLAEQERIVEVLRQADAIRRKRAEARRLADQILPALFLDMFGDPITNPKNWPVEPFEHVLKDETRKAGKLPIAEYQSQGEFPIIDQGEKFVSGYTDRADCVFDGALPVILFGDHTRRLKYVDFPFVLGADGVKILRPLKGVPSFIYQQLRASPIPSRGYERHFKYLKELSFVLPPKHLQEWLADCFTQYYESENHATEALLEAERIFDGILSRAFTGELTAE
jgi:type I restriction enzyme, S subunit